MDYDVIIVGGGHAGVEAALAAVRMGRKAAIVTMDRHKLALMSCNPAIGGIAKSHVVKEVDALGGLMGLAADATGIQFRRLNLSRGAAVWSTRVQADRSHYARFISEYVADIIGVDVIESLAGAILTENGKVAGVRTEDGVTITGKTVIICSGTFLGGLIHIGTKQIKAGRRGEKAAYRLSDSLKELGFEVGRLKTGTPPRIDGDSIDFSKCEIQPGHEPIPFFSHRSDRQPFEQTPCYLTYTTDRTKEIVSANQHLSAIFSGQIKSIGPRYCPSIEDKFHRFADKDRHQIFLEPEGNGTNEVYPNGFATSLPEDVQYDAIRTVTGLENVRITQPGYAIEYDYCPAFQVKPSLETRRVRGLFFAGQINGTSGYEEAAGQGLMAGINAVLYIEKEDPFVLDRSQAYIGVMIDDLTTRSTTEPYRLFTSRAEYRLAMREDNARDRLNRFAQKYGLVPEDEYQAFEKLQIQTEEAVRHFKEVRVKVSDLDHRGDRFKKVDSISLEKLLKQPGLTINEALPLIARFNGDIDFTREALERAVISIQYRGYVAKQEREIAKFLRMESEVIPDDFNFATLAGLKQEAKDKFIHFRPGSLGQAGRIEGVTPGDISVLSIHLLRHKRTSK